MIPYTQSVLFSNRHGEIWRTGGNGELSLQDLDREKAQPFLWRWLECTVVHIPFVLKLVMARAVREEIEGAKCDSRGVSFSVESALDAATLRR